MSQITPITIQTAASRGTFHGACAQAYFVVEDDQVILTDRDGHQLHDPDGRGCAQALTEGDNPRQIAARLLRGFRVKIRGDRVNGFDRALDYSNMNFKY